MVDILSNPKLNPVFAEVIQEAISLSDHDLRCVEGVRTKERQQRLWDLGEDQTGGQARLFGAAATLVVFIDDIPCFGDLIYFDVADSMRFAGQNIGVPIAWGGAINSNGFVDITRFNTTGAMRALHDQCFEDLVENGKSYRPVFQYFQIFPE
tara:strand:+ start:285 stop:740 length:456 start_codon:yes stop_codon:yes gene_type:complete